jgi:hypothetical protein
MTIRYTFDRSHCPFCQKQIYTGASTCQNCGAQKVDKFWDIYGVLGFAFFFVGIPGGCAIGIKINERWAPLGIPLTCLAISLALIVVANVRATWERLE